MGTGSLSRWSDARTGSPACPREGRRRRLPGLRVYALVSSGAVALLAHPVEGIEVAQHRPGFLAA